MVNVISKEDLITVFVGIGIKRFLLTNDNFCDIFAENRISGVILRGICYLDDGDGIKTQILIKIVEKFYVKMKMLFHQAYSMLIMM